MVKKRNRDNTLDNSDKIESFITSADSVTTSEKSLDPKAARKFKNLNVGMNEYEYTLLVQAAESSNRSLLNFIRSAAIKEAKIELNKD